MNSNVFTSGRTFSRVLTASLGKYSRQLTSQRSFSTQDPDKKSENSTIVIFEANSDDTKEEIFTQFKDELGNYRYKYFPLPGNSTVSEDFLRLKTPPLSKTFNGIESIVTESPEKKIQFDTIQQFLLKNRYDLMAKSAMKMNEIECEAHRCPKLVKKEFCDLFPDVNLSKQSLTAITFTQKTSQDMAVWSEQVETEREQSMFNFIGAAEELCLNLRSAGFWADFIDPCSGRPYFGSFTNATMFETDERYRHFGFTIEDLGCCKVISHFKHGTKAYVGVVFTSADVNSAALQKYLPSQTVSKDKRSKIAVDQP